MYLSVTEGCGRFPVYSLVQIVKDSGLDGYVRDEVIERGLECDVPATDLRLASCSFSSFELSNSIPFLDISGILVR
jgi:hypothetical protein